MDSERIKGGVKKATGTVKDKVGQMTGDRDLEAEGKADKAEGRARSAVGHAKDAAREIIGKK
ncbi:MAG TPA: CsbD family protein [Stellaceae bacterium]|nr:CsbD family protein [Stellaceae bacterium]